ncbi:ornithine carbamoyltransferase [Sedimentisphaera salicampi]|uniref:Ornithine carbamoyltransferase n=1 Tax=Sedimentisphaera salicampi TaxID=1941349 RepID=A0A1W6LPR1_9BACT|nr:ornithine carbamoyltransferase [Sedimentisphaera salicampi]ARN57741.1 Ornithine carbamoyltransferase [Sedimentisphaera salicampi]OXU14299.1 Ornithine carbamoyltransferase [Sedimentisphaera salicampi]
MDHFLSIKDCSADQLEELLELGIDLKKLYKSGARDLCLEGKILAMLFEKPSLRTRMSFQTAMIDLGGQAVYVKTEEDAGGIGKREPVKDFARVLTGYVDCIMARTYAHSTVTGLAEWGDVPVINALTDFSHPCQAMADVLTALEVFDKLEGIKFAYIGDGNNVARSLANACAKLGMELVIAAPPEHMLDEESVQQANSIKADSVSQCSDPFKAVEGANVIYTDTWVSMGQESEKQQRIKRFSGYQVNGSLLGKAPKDCRVMHCLPAYRGYEITDEVMESQQSVIFQQAENRLHFQRALIKYLLAR